MDDRELEAGRSGPLRRLLSVFSREEEEDEMYEESPRRSHAVSAPARSVAYKSQMSVRRQIMTFEDAYSAAQSYKKGEVQLVNLVGTEAGLRQKIVDFLGGVAFAQDGEMVEVGDHIYMLTPSDIFVDITPPTPRTAATWN